MQANRCEPLDSLWKGMTEIKGMGCISEPAVAERPVNVQECNGAYAPLSITIISIIIIIIVIISLNTSEW